MAKHERDLAKESSWREVLERQGSSGLNVRSFCQQERLAESAFHFWRRTIRQRDRQTKLVSPALKFVPAVIKPKVASEVPFTIRLFGVDCLDSPTFTSESN